MTFYDCTYIKKYFKLILLCRLCDSHFPYRGVAILPVNTRVTRIFIITEGLEDSIRLIKIYVNKALFSEVVLTIDFFEKFSFRII